MKPLPLLPPKGDKARNWAIAAMALFPFAFALMALWLGQDASWDFRNYHWYNAWAFLTGRYVSGIDFLPSQGQFFFNPLLDIPFFLLATHVPPKCAYFILALVQGLNFPLLFMISYVALKIKRTAHKTALCAGLAAMGMLGAMGIAEAGALFNDNIVSLGVFLSALLILRRLDWLLKAPANEVSAKAFLYALPAGLAAGLKLTCISFGAGMCLALLIATPDAKRCARLFFFFGLGLATGLAATYGHWAWYLQSHYDSPMFPFFNIIFRSPLVAPHAILDFPTPRNWTLPVFPFAFAIQPYLVNEIFWRDLRIPVLYGLFIALTALYWLSGKKLAKEQFGGPQALRFLLLTAGVAYYVWLFTETIYRYLLPLDMLSPLLIVLCLGILPYRKHIRWKIAAAVLAVIAVTMQPGDWARHDAWQNKIADVASIPALPKDAMVLMAGYDAYAYLLQSFPPDASYVRIESRGLPSNDDTGLNKLIHEKVKQHKGPLYLFIPAGDQFKQGQKALAFHHLAPDTASCRTITDNLYEQSLDRAKELLNSYPQKFQFCKLKRL